MKDKNFDVVIIGGGPAGMMAAGKAAENGVSVALLEKNSNLGKKLLLTGGGRCNLTQVEFDIKTLIKKFGKNGKFLFSSLFSFGPKEVIDFFEKRNLPTKTERDGRVFPTSDKAEDVLQVLQKYLKENNVQIFFDAEVSSFENNKNKIQSVKLKDGREISAKNFILSTGGKSYPTTGSTGQGYTFAKNLGHTVTPLSPALTPIKIQEGWIKNLQGLSFENITVSLIEKNKKKKNQQGEIIFTHFGISGPVILNMSKEINISKKISIDFFPELNQEKLDTKIKKDFKENINKNIINCLSQIIPQKLAEIILKINNLNEDKKINSVTKNERIKIITSLKNFRLTTSETFRIDQAMITSGGINLKEIDSKTMRSKIVSNLFFAGEILDLDGPTGGYNLQIAWSTGHTAGKNVKK